MLNRLKWTTKVMMVFVLLSALAAVGCIAQVGGPDGEPDEAVGAKTMASSEGPGERRASSNNGFLHDNAPCNRSTDCQSGLCVELWKQGPSYCTRQCQHDHECQHMQSTCNMKYRAADGWTRKACNVNGNYNPGNAPWDDPGYAPWDPNHPNNPQSPQSPDNSFNPGGGFGHLPDRSQCNTSNQCQSGLCVRSYPGGPYVCTRRCQNDSHCALGSSCNLHYRSYFGVYGWACTIH